MRVVLLAIFLTGLVAGFVKPVGNALEGKAFVGGALLSLVAYVLYDAIKELTAAMAERENQPAQTAIMRVFGDEVVAAFGTGRIELCVMGYTGETLLHEIEQGLRALRGRAGQVDRIRIRILAPDFSVPRLVPARLEGDGRVDDPDFRDEIRVKCKSIATQLEGRVEELKSAVSPSREISCEYRVYDGVPDLKVVILNEETVLFGVYDHSSIRLVDGKQYVDPSGADTPMNRVSASVGRGAAQAEALALVKTWRILFDGRWALSTLPRWRRVAPGSGV
ncbi:hypothetical protein ABZ930_29240 [Streptomyces sp. NPDC046716]|uniref:hypothetical protein n=1 Tax=Streptomyces sp. NPDC046716 TaxID=3157093 RepID=UPI0033C90448